MADSTTTESPQLLPGIPTQIGALEDAQRDLPRIAKDSRLMAIIEDTVQGLDSQHEFFLGDSSSFSELLPNSVHLVLTSPPYWSLKKYRDTPGQLGHIEDYSAFLTKIENVWKSCYDALVPGGRLVIVVGDVCLSRRRNNGRHAVIPLHASIQESCRELGFDNLAPIIWHKIANANYEVAGNGGGFLGKPYEPNAVIKNDVEYILMQRKPGGYRSPPLEHRLLSLISHENHKSWFQQIWSGVTGASTRKHPAPYPLELAERLIRMFSFVGDTVVDPFLGTGTTSVAAARYGRNSIGVEIDPVYFDQAVDRMKAESKSMFKEVSLRIHGKS